MTRKTRDCLRAARARPGRAAHHQSKYADRRRIAVAAKKLIKGNITRADISLETSEGRTSSPRRPFPAAPLASPTRDMWNPLHFDVLLNFCGRHKPFKYKFS